MLFERVLSERDRMSWLTAGVNLSASVGSFEVVDATGLLQEPIPCDHLVDRTDLYWKMVTEDVLLFDY